MWRAVTKADGRGSDVGRENALRSAFNSTICNVSSPRTHYILCCKDVSELTARGHLKGTSQSRSQIRSFVGRAIKIRTLAGGENVSCHGAAMSPRRARVATAKRSTASKNGVDWPKRRSICISIILCRGLGGPGAVIASVIPNDSAR